MKCYRHMFLISQLCRLGAVTAGRQEKCFRQIQQKSLRFIWPARSLHFTQGLQQLDGGVLFCSTWGKRSLSLLVHQPAQTSTGWQVATVSQKSPATRCVSCSWQQKQHNLGRAERYRSHVALQFPKPAPRSLQHHPLLLRFCSRAGDSLGIR